VFVVTVPGADKCAFKLFSEPSRQRARKLRFMLDHPPAFVTKGGDHVAWPLDIGTNEAGEVAGYLMPFARGTSLAEYYGHESLALRVRLALNAARVLEPIHWCGYMVGDMHDDNTLGKSDGTVTFVDCESFVFGEYRGSLGRLDFLPPELASVPDFDQVPRSLRHDYWSFATMVFLLLMQCHPFRACYTGSDGATLGLTEKIIAGHWPYARNAKLYVPPPDSPAFTALPAEIQFLFRRAFELGHGNDSLRPDASEWKRALEKFDRQLSSHVSKAPRTAPVPAKQAVTSPEQYTAPARRADPVARIAPLVPRQASPDGGIFGKCRAALTALGRRWWWFSTTLVAQLRSRKAVHSFWVKVATRRVSWELLGGVLIVALLLLCWWMKSAPNRGTPRTRTDGKSPPAFFQESR
jgi:hypothetical protein